MKKRDGDIRTDTLRDRQTNIHSFTVIHVCYTVVLSCHGGVSNKIDQVEIRFSIKFSSLQFSLDGSAKPIMYAVYPVSQKFTQRCL